MEPSADPAAPRAPERPVAPAPVMWAGGILLLIVAAVALFLAFFDWDMLRGPIGRYASARTGRTVRIEGHLQAHLLTWSPQFTAQDLRIGEPAWVGKRGTARGDMADIARLTVSVKLLPLLRGQTILPLLDVEKPDVFMIRDASGRNNWTFGPRTDKPASLPPIQQFIITDGHLRIVDGKRRLSFSGVVNAREQRDGPNRRGLRLDGTGMLNGKPFLAQVMGGPLLNVRPNRPYPFDADVRAGDTHVHARGIIPKPFNFGLLDARLSVSGRNLADLYYLTGLALPSTPAYSLAGRLQRDKTIYRFTGMSGRVGSSDLEGALTIDRVDGRPHVDGALKSRVLDYRDVAPLLGAKPRAGGGVPDAGGGRLLPDAPLYADRMRSMDAQVRYRAEAVRSFAHMPLTDVTLDLTLDHGLLTMHPLSIGLPQGRLRATVALNARGPVPVTDLDARLNGASLAPFFKPAAGGTSPLEGTLMARAKLHAVGASVHKAAAASNGAITLVVPHGRLRESFAELLGIDVSRGLFLLLSKDQSTTDIRCAVADFRVKDGVLHADRIVADTGVVLIKGSGSVNLGDETMNLTFKGDPKSFRLIRLRAPITVKGPLRGPHVGVDVGAAAGQIGVGAAVGAFLAPLAVVLPFVDPGLAKNADCAGLFAEARSNAAPVKSAPAKAAPAKTGGRSR